MTPLETYLLGAAFALVIAMGFLLYPRARMEITDRGLLDRQLRLGWIRWDEIEGAYPPNRGDAEGLRLRLKPSKGLLHRLMRRGNARARVDGTYELHLDLTETDISPVELLQEVVARAPRGTSGPRAGDS